MFYYVIRNRLNTLSVVEKPASTDTILYQHPDRKMADRYLRRLATSAGNYTHITVAHIPVKANGREIGIPL